MEGPRPHHDIEFDPVSTTRPPRGVNGATTAITQAAAGSVPRITPVAAAPSANARRARRGRPPPGPRGGQVRRAATPVPVGARPAPPPAVRTRGRTATPAAGTPAVATAPLRARPGATPHAEAARLGAEATGPAAWPGSTSSNWAKWHTPSGCGSPRAYAHGSGQVPRRPTGGRTADGRGRPSRSGEAAHGWGQSSATGAWPVRAPANRRAGRPLPGRRDRPPRLRAQRGARGFTRGVPDAAQHLFPTGRFALEEQVGESPRSSRTSSTARGRVRQLPDPAPARGEESA